MDGTYNASAYNAHITQTIQDRGADYILALKGNQGTLHEDVTFYFNNAINKGCLNNAFDYHETTDADHGRIEIRRYWICNDVDWLDQYEQWSGLKSIGLAESERHIGDEITIERRYFISSLDKDAQQFGHAIRKHWGIENNLHWVLDVAFREDESRVRKNYAPENMAMLRHITLNLLKQETTLKRGIKTKRLKSGWDESYLFKVLGIAR